MSEEAQKAWYEANCHCGAVRCRIHYPSLENPETKKVNCCNCSICTKNGYLLIYPERQDVVWTKGFDHLKSYKCATKTKDHLFCPTCGSSILIDFNGTNESGDYLAVNVGCCQQYQSIRLSKANGNVYKARMIHDINPQTLNLRYGDYKSFGEPYSI